MASEPGDAPAAHPTVEAMLRERLEQLIGGWRGAVEAAAPTVAFVAVWTWRQDLRAALLAAGEVYKRQGHGASGVAGQAH